MGFKYQIGDKVRVTSLPHGAEVVNSVEIDDVGVVVEVDEDDCELTYMLNSENWKSWWFSEDDLETHLGSREDVIKEIQNTQSKLDELHKLLETFEWDTGNRNAYI